MTFNLLVIGSGYVGKTSFIKENAGILQDFSGNLEVYTLDFSTNKGDVKFRIFDSNTVNDMISYGVAVHAAIIMVSSDVKRSFSYAISIKEELSESFGDIPTLLLINKCDIGGSVNLENINGIKRFIENNCRRLFEPDYLAWKIPVILTSTKIGYNCYLPFIYFIQRLLDGSYQQNIKYSYLSDIQQGQPEEEEDEAADYSEEEDEAADYSEEEKQEDDEAADYSEEQKQEEEEAADCSEEEEEEE